MRLTAVFTTAIMLAFCVQFSPNQASYSNDTLANMEKSIAWQDYDGYVSWENSLPDSISTLAPLTFAISRKTLPNSYHILAFTTNTTPICVLPYDKICPVAMGCNTGCKASFAGRPIPLPYGIDDMEALIAVINQNTAQLTPAVAISFPGSSMIRCLIFKSSINPFNPSLTSDSVISGELTVMLPNTAKITCIKQGALGTDLWVGDQSGEIFHIPAPLDSPLVQRRYSTGTHSVSCISVDKSGKVFVGGADGSLYAFGSTGQTFTLLSKPASTAVNQCGIDYALYAKGTFACKIGAWHTMSIGPFTPGASLTACRLTKRPDGRHVECITKSWEYRDTMYYDAPTTIRRVTPDVMVVNNNKWNYLYTGHDSLQFTVSLSDLDSNEGIDRAVLYGPQDSMVIFNGIRRDPSGAAHRYLASPSFSLKLTKDSIMLDYASMNFTYIIMGCAYLQQTQHLAQPWSMGKNFRVITGNDTILIGYTHGDAINRPWPSRNGLHDGVVKPEMMSGVSCFSLTGRSVSRDVLIRGGSPAGALIMKQANGMVRKSLIQTR